MPGSEFAVSRTAHRNNTSDYYINDRKSSFGEVTELLKRKGIDLDNNRFLILQVHAHPMGPLSGIAEGDWCLLHRHLRAKHMLHPAATSAQTSCAPG